MFKQEVSRSLMTISAMTGESGDPMRVPNVCLYITLLKIKYVDVKINLMACTNSFFEIFVLFWIRGHLLLILSRTRSRGTFVKRDVTSKVSRIRFFESTLYNSKLFAIALNCITYFSRLIESIYQTRWFPVKFPSYYHWERDSAFRYIMIKIKKRQSTSSLKMLRVIWS